MRRNVLLICLSLLLGCSKENRQDVLLSHLRDSLGVLMQYGILHKDTTMLQQALQLSDSLLQIDTVSWNRYIIYYNRSSIYTELGNIHEAMINKKKAIMLLPSDNIERQMYLANQHLWGSRDDAICMKHDEAVVVNYSFLQQNIWEMVSPGEKGQLLIYFQFYKQKMKETVRQKGTGREVEITDFYYLSDTSDESFNKEFVGKRTKGKYIVVEDKLGEAFWWQVISVTPSELKLLTQYGETIILKKVISK